MMKARHWLTIAAAIIALWLAAMVAASWISYEHRSPQRIENWKPDPAK